MSKMLSVVIDGVTYHATKVGEKVSQTDENLFKHSVELERSLVDQITENRKLKEKCDYLEQELQRRIVDLDEKHDLINELEDENMELVNRLNDLHQAIDDANDILDQIKDRLVNS